MDERRSRKRWHTILRGRIISLNRHSLIECTVRDLSDTGARIYFADVSAIPSEFEIEIPNRGLRAQARLMWSRGANHGIMFLNKAKAWTDLVRTAAA